MALTGEAFGFSLGINVLIALSVFLFFGAIRRAGGLSKFYQPKRLPFYYITFSSALSPFSHLISADGNLDVAK